MTAVETRTGTGRRGPAAGPRATARMGRSARRRSMGTAFVYAVLLMLVVIYIYPFLVQVATSFKTDNEAVSSPLSLVPATWSTAAYQRLFLRSDFPLWFTNSVIVTVCVTVGRV